MSVLKRFKKLSKRFKVFYFGLGVIVFVLFGWTMGFTRLAMSYISNLSIQSDEIYEIHEVYKNKSKGIVFCATGETSGETDIEFWAEIPSDRIFPDPEYEKKFNHKIYGRNNVSRGFLKHDLIKVTGCNSSPHADISRSNISVKNIVSENYESAKIKINKIIDQTNQELLIHSSFNDGFFS